MIVSVLVGRLKEGCTFEDFVTETLTQRPPEAPGAQ
jgi:hypothetical protein